MRACLLRIEFARHVLCKKYDINDVLDWLSKLLSTWILFDFLLFFLLYLAFSSL